MIVSIIVAMDEHRGIGKDNRLPWRLSVDLRRFKELTMGHHLIVGRKTYESIGRPLPGRKMVIVSRDPNYFVEGADVVSSVRDALALAERRGETESFIGGGASIYEEALPLTDRIYLTRVKAEVDADTFFPAFEVSDWSEQVIERHESDEKNEHSCSFCLLDRRR